MTTPHERGHGSRDDASMAAVAPIIEDPHSIAALMKHPIFEKIAPTVFSFMSVIELMYIEQTNNLWLTSAAEARHSRIKRLHLGQFWSRIGLMEPHYFTALCSKFHAINDLNVGYCHFITGEMLFTLIESIPNYQNIIRLNLFYCYNLQDQHIEKLLTLLPNLADINLGRCINLTDKAFSLLAMHSPHLKVLQSNILPRLTEESLMLFDDTTMFPSLTHLNLVHSGSFKELDLDELRASCAAARPALKIIGPENPIDEQLKHKVHRRQTQKGQNDLSDS